MNIICFLLSVMMLLGVSAWPAYADGVEIPDFILYTCYCGGGSIQAGCVDEKGGIWLFSGQESELQWPDSASEQLSYLASCGLLTRQGRLNDSDLQDIVSLVSAVPDQGGSGYPVSSGSGRECSYAVRIRPGWPPSPVLLGISGDECFENTDANAQALYLSLRNLFPQITDYAYAYGAMGPQGFTPVPVMSFCGFWGLNLENASISAAAVSGAGSFPMELTDEEQNRIRSIALSGQVTGKANASWVNGNSTVYSFLDETGNTIASMELYNGLLVRPDGMYYIG